MLDGCDICGGAHTNDEHLAADDTPLDPAVLAAAERISDRYENKSADDFDPIADADYCDLHEWAGYGECPRCKPRQASPEHEQEDDAEIQPR